MVEVEVVYVPEEGLPYQKCLMLPEGSNIEDALQKSGLEEFGLDFKSLSVGIFSKQMSKETLLKSGDRVEIYRSLKMDPKEKRRIRANRS